MFLPTPSSQGEREASLLRHIRFGGHIIRLRLPLQPSRWSQPKSCGLVSGPEAVVRPIAKEEDRCRIKSGMTRKAPTRHPGLDPGSIFSSSSGTRPNGKTVFLHGLPLSCWRFDPYPLLPCVKREEFFLSLNFLNFHVHAFSASAAATKATRAANSWMKVQGIQPTRSRLRRRARRCSAKAASAASSRAPAAVHQSASCVLIVLVPWRDQRPCRRE